MQRYKRPNGGGSAPVRSVRVTDAVWARVVSRAAREGVTPSYVMGTFLEGYANGHIGLPRVKVEYDGMEAS